MESPVTIKDLQKERLRLTRKQMKCVNSFHIELYNKAITRLDEKINTITKQLSLFNRSI